MERRVAKWNRHVGHRPVLEAKTWSTLRFVWQCCVTVGTLKIRWVLVGCQSVGVLFVFCAHQLCFCFCFSSWVLHRWIRSVQGGITQHGTMACWGLQHALLGVLKRGLSLTIQWCLAILCIYWGCEQVPCTSTTTATATSTTATKTETQTTTTTFGCFGQADHKACGLPGGLGKS